MKSARKLILVDESDREYKRLQRPTNAVAKTKHSLEVSNTLRDSTLADDQKVRKYVAAPSILKLAQTSSGGTDRASQPYHRCAAAASAATTTTTTGVSHTIAFADDSETRQTAQKAASSVVSLLTWRARTPT